VVGQVRPAWMFERCVCQAKQKPFGKIRLCVEPRGSVCLFQACNNMHHPVATCNDSDSTFLASAMFRGSQTFTAVYISCRHYSYVACKKVRHWGQQTLNADTKV
jgi:hypothetical protein